MAETTTLNQFRAELESARFDDSAQTLETALSQVIAASRAAPPVPRAGGAGGASVPESAPPPVDAASVSTLAAREFERMKGYLIQYYEGVSPTVSFQDAAGSTIDCLPFQQQPTAKAAQQMGIVPKSQLPPPPVVTVPTRSAPAPMAGGMPAQITSTTPAPPGSVPIRRVTLQELTQRGSLDQYFRKGPPNFVDARPDFGTVTPQAPPVPVTGPLSSVIPAGAVIPERHLHAGFQFGPFQQPNVISGASSTLNVWDPNPGPGVMSLSQQWILCNVRTSTTIPLQTIESGWQVFSPTIGGSLNAILFIFFNPDGYNPARRGYVSDQNHFGFIGASGAQWAPGVALSPVSVRGGSQFGVVMVWTREDSGPNAGDWNFYMGTSPSNLSAVGYFPGQLYSALSRGADFIQFGGEVASAVGATATGPMGSGVMPSDASLSNFGNVAFQSQLKLQPTGSTAFTDVDESVLLPIAEVPQLYSAAFGSSSDFGKYFFFGGAGAP
jgi:hypothetical protein